MTVCPQCGGSNVESVQVAHDRGTSHMLGALVGLDDIAGFQGIIRTQEAARIAPPSPKSEAVPWLICFGSLIILLILLAIIWSPPLVYEVGDIDLQTGHFKKIDERPQAFTATAFAVIILGGVTFVASKIALSNGSFNGREFVALKAAHGKRWVCRQCGTVFTPRPAKVEILPHVLSSHNGSGHFVISGVDRETKMDTTWHCDAASEANARAKAELEGIIVTAVSRT